MREFINKFGVVIIVTSLVIAALAYFFFGRSSHNFSQGLAYYVDDNDLSYETTDLSRKFPPFQKDGRTLVMAIKKSCDGGKTAKLSYLLKYSDEAKKQLDEADPNSMEVPQIMEKGTMVRTPQPGSQWYLGTSPEGEKIIAGEGCPGNALETVVLPR